MSSPMISTQFRTVVSPIISTVFDGLYDQYPLIYPMLFNVKDGTPRNQHIEPLLTGFGAAVEFGNGEPISYDQGQELYTANYLYQTFGLAFAITKEMQEDGDAINFAKLYAEHLARSMRFTEETNAANVYNRGFNSSFVGGDGVSLFNAAHPTLVGNQSNVLATPAALSQTSLEQMLIQISQAKDSNGKPIKLKAQKLAVAPSNQMTAEVILKTVGRTGTANNDLNPIKSMGAIDSDAVDNPYFTSNTAWFVTTNAPQGLQFMWRTRTDRQSSDDFETKSVKNSARARYKAYFTDWRGGYGTPGQ